MPTLLRIDSSAGGADSCTRRLTSEAVRGWRSRGAEFEVVERDLNVDPLPHLDAASLHWPERLREGHAVSAEALETQESVIEELLAADAVVIGAPMYNYSLPSTLKAWLDYVHIPGRTVPFDIESRPNAGKRVIVASARGGENSDGAFDHVIEPLRLALGAGMGMKVTSVTLTRTLADRVPELGLATALAELERAIREVGQAAVEL